MDFSPPILWRGDEDLANMDSGLDLTYATARDRQGPSQTSCYTVRQVPS